MPPSCNGCDLVFCVSDKAKLFDKYFSRNFNLDHLGVSLPTFPSATNLYCTIFLQFLSWLKKVMINLDLFRVSRPYCIPVVILEEL